MHNTPIDAIKYHYTLYTVQYAMMCNDCFLVIRFDKNKVENIVFLCHHGN